MKVRSLDHFVLTVADIPATVAFYAHLGMAAITFGDGRTALTFGEQKINLHQADRTFAPKARVPMPGSGDFCLLSDVPVADWIALLRGRGIAIEAGPVQRTGATGPILSIYLRDPDGNLVEIANPL